ncbi:MAG: ATPase, partial [Nanohaloarchaea archaeon SW_7_46_7]
MTEKIVPDTSIIIDGKLSELIERGETKTDIVIPEFVVDELENQANEGKETGYRGIEEIKKIRMLAEREGLNLSFKGRKSTTEEIELSHNGRIDALIRDMAEEMDATLFTADAVQGKIARAKGIEVREFKTETDLDF